MTENYIQGIANKIRVQFKDKEVPAQGLDFLFSLYAALVLIKGQKVEPRDVHNAWAVWATQFDPLNDSLVPFEQLSKRVQAEDMKFVDAIKNVSQQSEL